MGSHYNPVDIGEAIPYLWLQCHRCCKGSLGEELRGKADLEQDIFHHISALVALQIKFTHLLRFYRQVLVIINK